MPYAFPRIAEQAARGGQFPFMQESGAKKLWNLLGVDLISDKIANHGYNPLLRSPELPPEIVFVGNAALGPNRGSQSLFDEEDPISSETQSVVFMFPGWITKKENVKLKFTPLVRTSKVSGYV